MNSYKIIFNRFTKIVVFWNWYDNAIEYVTQQLCCIFLLLTNPDAVFRIGLPDEISGAVTFLASDKDSSYISGETIVIAGGEQAHL